MDGNVVSAAKWFGGCLIVSALILVIGFSSVMKKSVHRLGSSMENAASRSRSSVSFPNNLTLNLRSSGPFGIDLSPNNKSINLAPIKVELVSDKPASEDAN